MNEQPLTKLLNLDLYTMRIPFPMPTGSAFEVDCIFQPPVANPGFGEQVEKFGSVVQKHGPKLELLLPLRISFPLNRDC